MLRTIYIDQMLCKNEGISINAAVIFDVILKLSTHSQIEKIVRDEKVYTVLYRNMILKQIEFFSISTRTLSGVLKELEEAGLIICINKNTTPAYRTTEKADEYNFLPKANGINTNDNKSKRKQQLFSLGKKTRIEKLTEQYKKLLQEKAKEYCEDSDLDYAETFQSFVDYHSSKGNAFVNWLSAFRTWCRNAKRFNLKTDKDDKGLYG